MKRRRENEVEESMSRFAGLIGLLAAASTAFWAPPSPGQEPYPSRTVKIVVPSQPGSTTDTLARLVADQLTQKWGKAAIVENIPGGAMNIGALSVARAAPDGYTLLIAPPSPLSFNHLLYRDPGYEPTRFVPITMLAKISNVLVVRKDLPATTLKQLIDYGKANPGKLSYASQGVGSTAHLSAAQLEARAGIKMVHVPYRGAQPALTDVVAGHVDMFFDTLATSVPLYRDNKVKLLGVADVKRAAAVPEIPTISEAGLPDFRSITWFGLVAPPATPAALAEKINRDVVELLESKDVAEMLRKMSLEPGATAPAETTRFFAEETALWSKVIKEAGIEPQ
jgi:tripartite-type tricarboxylate transporter receptor subunit TctC